MKRFVSLFMVVLLMGTLLTGCFNSEPAADDKEPKVLRILGYEWSVNELTKLFEVSQDNVTVEVIDLEDIITEKRKQLEEESDGTVDYTSIDYLEIFREVMTGPNAPDLVYITDTGMISKLANEGLLLPLETYINDSKFPIDKIAAAVREGLTELGGGTLYALTPTYTSSALFYNKDFFDARGLSYPTDGMTWDEVFNLARQLSYEENGEKKYGISFGYGYLREQIYIYSQGLGIQRFDEDFTTFTVDTPEMEKIWSTIVDLTNEGVIAPMYDWEQNQRDVYIPFQDDDFISGRAAMKIGSFSDLRTLSDVFSGVYYWGADAQMPEAFDWDVVTVPTHPENPNVGGNIYYGYLMGINANAENPDVAWEYISFINGERVAKVLAKNNYELPSRTDFAQAPNGLNINMNAFTALKPAPQSLDDNIYLKFPNGEYWEIYSLEYTLLDEVKNGTKTVKEALAEYQMKGQEILDRLNQQLQDGSYGEEEGPINILPVEGGSIDNVDDEPAEGSEG